jgi:hypothetical protein
MNQTIFDKFYICLYNDKAKLSKNKDEREMIYFSFYSILILKGMSII